MQYKFRDNRERASCSGERASRVSEKSQRASLSGEQSTIFTRASERERGFLNFPASERASCARARQNFAF